MFERSVAQLAFVQIGCVNATLDTWRLLFAAPTRWVCLDKAGLMKTSKAAAWISYSSGLTMEQACPNSC